MSDQDSSPSREREEALQRFFALSTADQLRAHQEIKTYLADELGEEDELDRIIAQRGQALGALRRVFEELRARGALSADRAPTAAQFDQLARELRLEAEPGAPWGRARIVRAYGSWRNAQAALLGETVLESPVQRQQRRKAGGKRRTHEEPLAALRAWLRTEPVSRTMTSYDDFAKSRNRKLEKGGAQRFPTAIAITMSLALTWAECLRAAESPGGFEKIHNSKRAALTETLADEELIGSKIIQALLDQNPHVTRVLLDQDHFPAPVATIGRTRAWLAGDIKLYAAGKPVPQRKHGELQAHVLGSVEIAQRLGIHIDYVRTKIGHRNWARSPKARRQGRLDPLLVASISRRMAQTKEEATEAAKAVELREPLRRGTAGIFELSETPLSRTA